MENYKILEKALAKQIANVILKSKQSTPAEILDMCDSILDIFFNKCLRCGYAWPKKEGKTPGTCANPKCKSPYWNKPKIRA